MSAHNLGPLYIRSIVKVVFHHCLNVPKHNLASEGAISRRLPIDARRPAPQAYTPQAESQTRDGHPISGWIEIGVWADDLLRPREADGSWAMNDWVAAGCTGGFRSKRSTVRGESVWSAIFINYFPLAVALAVAGHRSTAAT